ncbi:MAG: [FeFe] hydrogenase H-cluster maturation GTPase HydF [Candidatus Coatesbacteria bacterium]|nr:[FeFe] hydrogenase H-cluster maturation GTPase HydF [Candidatus Coatesbacteria bacterium]
MRPHIILLGRRNVGKSSLVNALCESALALVSNVPGTTTDPVRKAFELLPFGPVVFVDTGGVDDTGELGELRVERTRRELKKADFALLVVENGVWGDYEQTLLRQLEAAKTPFLVVVNKTDLDEAWRAPVDDAWYVSALKGENTRELRAELAGRLRELVKRESTIVGDLVTAGDLVVLVVPIDLEAPAGRLILPQVMTIRDLLDNDAVALVVKERELYATLSTLGRRPDLVITDSQAVLKVTGDVEPEIPLTTFSILFARLKGDLHELTRGVKVIDKLRDGDRVLIAEACSHHPVGDDIGRVKIPRWIRQYTGVDVEFVNVQGREYPENLDDYSLIIHCGACMLTPKAMESRMDEAAGHSVPITNYGVTISYVQGVLERVIAPFGLTLEDL